VEEEGAKAISLAETCTIRFFRSFFVELSIPVQNIFFWPYDLLSKHPDFVQTRILTWGYDSRVVSEFFATSDQHNISQHGNDLMVALQQERKRNVRTTPVLCV
jgi:hypothetical protein